MLVVLAGTAEEKTDGFAAAQKASPMYQFDT